MSLPEDDVTVRSQTKLSAGNNQNTSEIHLREDDPQNSKDENLKSKKLLKTNQSERRSISPLAVLKEDFSQLKSELLSMFKDKEVKTPGGDGSSSQTRTSGGPLSLLKEELSQFKEDVSSVFKTVHSSDSDNTGLATKGDASIAVLIKASEAEGGVHSGEALKNMCRDDQTSVADGQRGEETICTRRPCQTSAAKQTIKAVGCRNSSSQVSGEDKKEEEGEPLQLKSLPSGISLLCLSDEQDDPVRDQQAGDQWSVKNFACYLTFDPNTANSELLLSDCNRTATRIWSEHQPCNHPDRFQCCPQVLCREGLLDSVYWEVVWSGGADIGVTYNSISRGGDAASCLLGHNEHSWSLECSEGSYSPSHNNRRFRSCSPRPFTHRVGVYLNWSAGSLSFYCVSQDAMVHLHTFTATFTEPLYPGFWVWAYDGSVSLCQVELDWERLLK
ncbi:uncharacterized protein ACBR49_008345 [Aulostomus maculatus]